MYYVLTCLYVDIIIIGNSTSLVLHLITKLDSFFSLKQFYA